MNEPVAMPEGRTVIGGRHGSPSVTIALPFSRIGGGDEELLDAVAELGTLIARLAAATPTDATERELVHKAAEELVARVTR